MIEAKPYKRNENPSLGFAWADIVRPMGCVACGWHGVGANFHPIDAEWECKDCGSRRIHHFPAIEPDMLQ